LHCKARKEGRETGCFISYREGKPNNRFSFPMACFFAMGGTERKWMRKREFSLLLRGKKSLDCGWF